MSINQAEIKSQLYVQYITVDPPYLTGCGLYVLRKGFILVVSISSDYGPLISSCFLGPQALCFAYRQPVMS